MNKLYTNNDIQKILDLLSNNTEYRTKFLQVAFNQLNNSDYFAITNVIKQGYYEAFDRYDSDVCEQFLHVYELIK